MRCLHFTKIIRKIYVIEYYYIPIQIKNILAHKMAKNRMHVVLCFKNIYVSNILYLFLVN